MIPLSTAGADPGRRERAPGDLAAVQALVNTRNALTGQDLWVTPERTAAWLQPVLGAGELHLSDPERRTAVELREVVRALLLAHRDGTAPAPAVLETWGARLSAGALRPVLQEGRVLLLPQGRPVERLTGWLARTVAAAEADGTWTRLKACPGEHCGWAYYDRSPAATSAWCSMSVCGGRAKARASRRRAREDAGRP